MFSNYLRSGWSWAVSFLNAPSSRLLRSFLIKYIKDEDQQSSFQFQLGQGKVNIENIFFNEKLLNKKLAQVAPHIKITSAWTEKLSLDINYTSLLSSRNVTVYLKNVKIRLRYARKGNPASDFLRNAQLLHFT